MSKTKRRLKGIIVVLQLLVLVVVSVNSVSGIQIKDNNLLFKVKQKKSFNSLSNNSKQVINKSLDKCMSDGNVAAENINKLKSEKEDFEIGVRKVLDKYYSMEKSERTELYDFADEIDASAKTILDNYKEAENERENQENLHFETEKIVVAFPNGTAMETIETIVKNEAIDYEVIDDGKAHINENLPDYKKKRLEKVRDRKSDIIILADISLEDTVVRAADKFEKYDCVKSASDNTYFEADGTITTNYSATTNDPNFNSTTQWNMLNVDVPRAWNKFNSVVEPFDIYVAVIDCGVQMNHPDLKNVLLRDLSVDVTRNNKKLIDCDDSKQWKNGKGQYTGEHGTMVAGVLMAQGNNSTLGAGIASVGSVSKHRNPFKIMAIKCDNEPENRHITKSFLAKAINYAVDNGAEVINISYSAEKIDYSTTDFSAVKTAISNAIAADVSVVCSAGNDGSDVVRYPAGFPGVIGVGAVYKNGDIAKYSNESSAVDILAPGGYSNGAQVFSTTPTTHNSSGYAYSQGTSYAAPLVAGTVAMMVGINYDLTPSQILTRLLNRTTSSVSGDIDGQRQFKILNAGKAVELTQESGL